MDGKVDEKKNQAHGKVEFLSISVEQDGLHSQPPKNSKPIETIANFDHTASLNSVSWCSNNEAKYARALLKSCSWIQAFGVTAAVIAFLAFVIPNYELLKTKPVQFAFCFIPIILAYFLSLNNLILTEKMNDDPNTLLGICWFIFFLDALLLGALVGMTGGPSNSLFTPLFLLIPTAMSCYCHPKRFPFWIVFSTVILTYVIVAFLEYHKIKLFQDAQPPTLTTQLIITGIFTVACITTATICCLATHKIREQHCNTQRPNNSEPTICNKLYF